MKKNLKRIPYIFLVFLIFSLIGWIVETVFKLITTGHFENRGFLTLPFCTIYGTCVTLIYLILGTPQNARLLIGRIKKTWIRVIVYALASMVIATLAELIVGVFFDKVLNTMLWDYSDQPLNLRGYICLLFSLIWGALITLVMSFGYTPIMKLVNKIKLLPVLIVDVVLLVAMIVDWIINFIKI